MRPDLFESSLLCVAGACLVGMLAIVGYALAWF
jgi:hypothetical protein